MLNLSYLPHMKIMYLLQDNSNEFKKQLLNLNHFGNGTRLILGIISCMTILFSQQQVYLGDYNDEITNVSDVVLVVNEIMGG